MSKKKERKAIVSAVRKLWDSLDTHLDWSIEKNPKEKDSRTFHCATAREYAEEMLKLIKALK